MRKSMVEANVDIKQSVKEYLSPMDRFSVRLKASMSKSNREMTPADDQNAYFVQNHEDLDINKSSNLS